MEANKPTTPPLENEQKQNMMEDNKPTTPPLENEQKQNIGEEQMSILMSDDNLSSDDDDDEEIKIEDYIENDILYKFHPEIKNINNAEMEAMTKIKRDTNDKIIDENHTTIPIMTRYEKAKILGIRASQINSGADIFIDIPSNIIDGITIARMELEKKAIPFIIRRNLPNGKSEYWNIEDLEIL